MLGQQCSPRTSSTIVVVCAAPRSLAMEVWVMGEVSQALRDAQTLLMRWDNITNGGTPQWQCPLGSFEQR